MPSDTKKTKAQLIEELEAARRRIRQLEDGGKPAKPMGMRRALLAGSRDILESLPLLAVVHELPDMLYVNPAGAALLGGTEEELVGRAITDFVHPAEEKVVQERIRRLKTSQDNPPQEIRILSQDGKERTVQASSVLIQWEGGQAALLLAMDISDRKQAEESLLKHQALLVDAERMAQLGSWEWDVALDVWTISKSWLQIHGSQSSNMSSAELMEFCHPEDTQIVQAEFEKALKRGMPYDIEHRIVRGDTGEVRSIRAHGEVIAAPDGTPAKLRGIAQDITDRIQAEEALVSSEERFRAVFAAMPLMLGLWRRQDSEFVLAEVNEASMAVSDGKLANMIGKTHTEFYKNNPWIVECLERCHALKSPLRDEGIYTMRTTGKTHYLTFSFVPVPPDTVVIACEDISDRKRAEESLTQSERRYKALFHSSPVQAFAWRLEGGDFVLEDYNEMANIATEGHVAEFMGKPATEIYPDMPELVAQMHRCMASAELITKEMSYVKRYDGQPAMLDMRLARASADLLLMFTQDISDRKLAEHVLRESEKKFRSVVQLSPLGVGIVDAEGLLVDANQALADILNSSMDKLIGANFGDFTHPEDLEREWELIRDMWNKNEISYKMEKRFIRADGQVRWVRIASSLIAGEDGKGELGFAFVDDITERRAAQEELNNIAWLLNKHPNLNALGQYVPPYGDLVDVNAHGVLARYVGKETLLDIVSDYMSLLETSSAVYEADGSYALGLFSSGWCQFMDYASRSLCATKDNSQAMTSGKWLCHESCWTDASKPAIERGEVVDITCHGGLRIYAVPIVAGGKVVGAMNFGYGDPPRDEETLQQLADKYAVDIGELRLHAESYSTRPMFLVEAAKRRLQTSARIIGLMVELKQAKEELTRAKEEAEAANRAKSAFLANMSHEIRTPMSGVMGMLQLLQFSEMDDQQKDYVETALFSSKSLLSIISDILDFSKIEAGRIELSEENFQVNKLLQDVVSIFGEQALKSDVKLFSAIDPAVPGRIKADSARLRQVLFNLVGNSVKFTERGQISVALALAESSSDVAPRLRFTVADTGIGIPGDLQQQLFEPFTRAEKGFRRHYPGTGLGLSIVKRLVRLMGGDIEIDSQEGKGTTVCFEVAFAKPDEAAEPAKTAELEQAGSAANELPPMSVLLAEDDAVNRIAFQHILVSKGVEVTCAADGRQALDLLRQKSFDVVLMDVQMPEMDGVEATKAIRTQPDLAHVADVPIIATTAFALKGDKEKFLDAGMDGYISKPLDVAELVRVLSQIAPKKSDPRSS